jgi:PhnB protein
MANTKLDPYLFFNGNANEALEFYKGVFGGELSISKMGDAPDTKPEDKDKVMHGLLDGDVRLMASDSGQASPEAKKIELSLSGEDESKLKSYFDGLSAGGNIKMPLQKQFWGDTFGQVTDKYGIDWMVNITTPKEQ